MECDRWRVRDKEGHIRVDERTLEPLRREGYYNEWYLPEYEDRTERLPELCSKAFEQTTNLYGPPGESTCRYQWLNEVSTTLIDRIMGEGSNSRSKIRSGLYQMLNEVCRGLFNSGSNIKGLVQSLNKTIEKNEQGTPLQRASAQLFRDNVFKKCISDEPSVDDVSFRDYWTSTQPPSVGGKSSSLESAKFQLEALVKSEIAQFSERKSGIPEAPEAWCIRLQDLMNNVSLKLLDRRVEKRFSSVIFNSTSLFFSDADNPDELLKAYRNRAKELTKKDDELSSLCEHFYKKLKSYYEQFSEGQKWKEQDDDYENQLLNRSTDTEDGSDEHDDGTFKNLQDLLFGSGDKFDDSLWVVNNEAIMGDGKFSTNPIG